MNGSPSPTRPLVVEVVTPTCAQCRAMVPDIAAAAVAHAERVDFEVVDAATEVDRAKGLGVHATPTLIGFVDGREVVRHVGRRTRPELDAVFAALAEGSDPPQLGGAERRLRLLAGLALAGVGLVTGPTWLLVAVGGLVVGWAVVPLRWLGR